jgi:hypothetical protein
MKTLKILFYVSFALCLLQLAMHVLAPFGGPMAIVHAIENGLYGVMSGYVVVNLDWPPYSINPSVKVLQLINSIAAFICFASLFICCLLPLVPKMNLKTKYRTGISLCVFSLLLFIGGGNLWNYLVKVYGGIP